MENRKLIDRDEIYFLVFFSNFFILFYIRPYYFLNSTNKKGPLMAKLLPLLPFY